MAKKNKKKSNVVYSTNPNFEYEEDQQENQSTLPNGEQLLYVSIDRKKRKGKEVTLIENFVGDQDDLKELGKDLKSKCGVGGTSKNGEIIIQGAFRDKIIELLNKIGYQTKRKGG